MAKDANPGRAARLGAYYKVVTVYTIVVALGYGTLYVLRQKGYQLINTSILYWLWYALVIGVILLVGKFVTNMPKGEGMRRNVRISVGIVTVFTIFAMYIYTISQIDGGIYRYATIPQPGSSRTAILMRSDIKGRATETSEAKTYTAYLLYEKVNPLFCWRDSENADLILLQDDPDAAVDYEWSGDTITISTNGNTADETGESNVASLTLR